MIAISQRWQRVVQVLLGLGMLQGASIVTYVLLARLLEPAAYGSYRQLFLVNQIFWGVAFSALPTALLYFSGRAADPGERAAIIRRHLHLVLALGFAAAAVLLAAAEPIARLLGNPALAPLLLPFAAYPAAYMLHSIVPPVMVARERTAWLPYFTTGLALLNSVPVVLAAWAGAPLTTVVAVATAAAVAGAGAALALIVLLSRGAGGTQVGFRQILGYVTPLLAAAGISIVGLRLDQVVVSHLMGPALFAVYAVGAIELPIYSLIKSSSTSVLLPEMAAAAARQDWSAVRSIWQDLQRKNAALLLPASAALVVFAEEFITILFGAQYRAAAPIFAVFALLGPVRAVTFGLILRAVGRPWLDLAGAVLFLVIVALAIHPAVTFAGLMGAAVTVLLATCIAAAALLALTVRVTDRAIPAVQLYPPRLLGGYLGMLALFALLRLATDAAALEALVRLALSGVIAAGLSLLLLHGSRRRIAQPSG